MSLFCVGISKGYTNTWNHVKRRTRKPSALKAYWYDENLRFRSKRVSWTEAQILKAKGFWKIQNRVCKSCRCRVFKLVKKRDKVFICDDCQQRSHNDDSMQEM